MDAWVIAAFSAAGALIPVLGNWAIARLKARHATEIAEVSAHQEQRATDWEAGRELRDELRVDRDHYRTELERVNARLDECEDDRERLHRENGQIQVRMTELELRVREGRPDGNLGKAGGMSA